MSIYSTHLVSKSQISPHFDRLTAFAQSISKTIGGLEGNFLASHYIRLNTESEQEKVELNIGFAPPHNYGGVNPFEQVRVVFTDPLHLYAISPFSLDCIYNGLALAYGLVRGASRGEQPMFPSLYKKGVRLGLDLMFGEWQRMPPYQALSNCVMLFSVDIHRQEMICKGLLHDSPREIFIAEIPLSHYIPCPTNSSFQDYYNGLITLIGALVIQAQMVGDPQ